MPLLLAGDAFNGRGVDDGAARSHAGMLKLCYWTWLCVESLKRLLIGLRNHRMQLPFKDRSDVSNFQDKTQIRRWIALSSRD